MRGLDNDLEESEYLYKGKLENIIHMEKIADSKPTAEIIKELSPEMIKTICDAISQEFYSWELNEEDESN